MSVKFTAESMARMAKLVSEEPGDFATLEMALLLTDEARAAGVYAEATTAGLTFGQWQVVRNPRKELRHLILALD